LFGLLFLILIGLIFSSIGGSFGSREESAPTAAVAEGAEWIVMWSLPGAIADSLTEVALKGTTSEIFLVCNGYSGRSVDPTAVTAIDPTTGKTVRTISNIPDRLRIEAGDLDGDGVPELVLDERGGYALIVFDLTGHELWRYQPIGAIDIFSFCTGDVDGDGKDEVIVGYNGGFGLHLVDGTGRARWTTTRHGNIWDAYAADLNKDGAAEIVHTEAGGVAHIVDQRGGEIASDSTMSYGTEVFAGSIGAAPPAMFKLGSGMFGGGDERLFCIELDGKERWRYELGGKRHFVARRFALGRFLGDTANYLAVIGADSRVHILDGDGKAVSVWAPGKEVVAIAAVHRSKDKADLIVIATDSGVSAYELKSRGTSPLSGGESVK